MEDLQARALALRPDLQAARRSVTSATSQIGLAKANAKQDLNATFNYGHVNASNVGAFYFNIPLPIFNRNQGEVARTYFRADPIPTFWRRPPNSKCMTDVKNAYESLRQQRRRRATYTTKATCNRRNNRLRSRSSHTSTVRPRCSTFWMPSAAIARPS